MHMYIYQLAYGRERVRADLDPSGSLDLMFNSVLQRELEQHLVIISYRGV